MKYSGIGGQAVMEGVMMKNGSRYAVAVRKPDQEIIVETSEYQGMIKNETIRNLPIIRGVFGFVESLTLGMKTLTFSASFFEEESSAEGASTGSPLTSGGNGVPNDRDKNTLAGGSSVQTGAHLAGSSENDKKEDVFMGLAVVLAVVLAVGLFMVLPYGISLLFRKVIDSPWIIALFEGVLRLLIFLGYVAGISLMSDIKRVYMYHGAEHKCINCIEHGNDLTVENVRKSSRLHKRCGTSFLLIVMLISILFFMFIQVDSALLRLVLRLVLIPVIAGVSYEFIRLAGRSENAFVNIMSRPGLWLQKITTREPEDDMIEVAIASVEAVFDWKAYLKEGSV